MKTTIAIVLAAGEGTRMVSNTSKPLHKVAGKSLLGHVLTAISLAEVDHIAVVVGRNSSSVEKEAEQWVHNPHFFVQVERFGTAHAVLSAQKFMEEYPDADVLIAFGDTPLVSAETLKQLKDSLGKKHVVSVLGFNAKDPTGYGRLLLENGELTAIREHRDANEDERKVTLCNGGLMALKGEFALKILQRIDNKNIKGEFYLTDAVKIARAMGQSVTFVEASEDEVRGVNDRVQLAEVEALMQEKLRRQAMLQGATMIDPSSVFLSFDTRIGKDVVFEPHVVIGPNVVISDEAVIHAYCHLENTHLLPRSQVGPFARLRSNAIIEEKAKVGNFVEVKNATLGYGVKAGHLSYLGDANIGAHTNIGAGTITCNYDGWKKYRTFIGEGAFIGSNSSLVAPVEIGKGAYIGSGSTITKNVPEDALALGRGRQVVYEGWATRLRERKSQEKD